LPKNEAAVTALQFSANSRVLLVACDDRQIRLWDVGSKLAHTLWAVDDTVRRMELCDGGKSVLIAYDGAMELREFPAGKVRSGKMKLSESEKVCAASPAETPVLTATPTGPARLMDLATGNSIWTTPWTGPRIWAAVFRRDGQTVIAGCQDQRIRLWDARSGKALRAPILHGGIVMTVDVSRDGKTILSGSSDQTARLWNTVTGAVRGQPMRHASELTKVALSPDGGLALTICGDGSAHLWDVSSCIEMARPLQHDVDVVDGTFNADGKKILFTCVDGKLRLYDVPQPLPDNRKFVRAWARAYSDFQLDDQGLPQQLSQSEWLAAQRELASLQAPTTSDTASSGQR
jgi:WD40 repeat protein